MKKKLNDSSIIWKELIKQWRVMKLTFFVVLFGLIQVSAEVYPQQIKLLSMDLNNVTLREAFLQIENESNYVFFYNADMIDVSQKVSIDVQNGSIDYILSHLFTDSSIRYKIIDRRIVLYPEDDSSISKMIQKSVTVRGKVTDIKGVPIPGVSVVIQGTTQGSITDINGNYILGNVNANSVLLFSFVGMKKQKVVFKGQVEINVILRESTIGLDEVVAIGYGTVKKQNLTGSIASFKAEALEERSIMNVGETFAGQLSGVQAQQISGKPGTELQIKIRGVSTFLSNASEPLYVVDGIPLGRSMKDINPNDIESIEVLKDASSTAIYGARGSNGVVLISTKNGTEGKTILNFSVNYGLQQVDKIVDMMNTEQYCAHAIWYLNEKYIRNGGDLSTPMASRPGTYQYPTSFLNPESLPDVNWQKEITHIAPMQTYNLSASGGNEKGKYIISGSYMKQDGVIKETGYKRFNLRINASANINKNISLGMNMAPSFSTENDPEAEGKESCLHHATNMAPIVGTKSNTEEWGYTEGACGWPNPLERLKEVYDETRTNKVISNVWGQVKVKNLKFRSQLGYDFSEASNNHFKPSNVQGGASSTGSTSSNHVYSWVFQNTLNYMPKISKLFDTEILLGQSFENNKYYYMSGSASGFPNDDIYTLNVTSTPTGLSTSQEKSTLASFFGRASFNVKDKYLLTMNVRRDGSSNFGEDTKWGWFPSASIGWKMDREGFMDSTSDWLDLLKIRLSIGKTGNNNIGDLYGSLPLMGINNYTFGGGVVNGIYASTVGNPDLGWESKVSKDLGLDVSIFKGRIQANIDFYIDDTKDMLQDVPVSYMSGFDNVSENLGEIRNKGIEFEITTHNFTGSFKWNTSFNISKNENEVKKLGNNNADIFKSIGGSVYITRVGGSLCDFYMYQSDGLLQESDFDVNGNAIVATVSGQEAGNLKVVDQNKDGVIDSEDLTVLGNNAPDYFWGMTNQFSFKGFDLRLLLQASEGGKIFMYGKRHYDCGDTTRAHFPRWTRCWKPDDGALIDNTNVDQSWDGNTPYPFGNNPNYTDRWLYDASFVRIKNLTMGYNLPENFCNKWHMGAMRVYISCDNLYTWNNYPGGTPETNTRGVKYSTYTPGLDYNTYPLSRRYTLGVNLTF